MSEVPLATKYSPDNYPMALSNLVKRYQQGDGSAVNYTEVAFGEISDSKASTTLNFMSEINIIENTKHANYIVPEEVVNWQRKMGKIKKEAKAEVRQRLCEYSVYSEAEFVLKEEGNQSLDDLVEQVGGLVGIDEDEVSDLKRTMRVIAELGFLEIGDDGTVSLDTEVHEDTQEVSESSEEPEDSPDESLDSFVDSGDSQQEEEVRAEGGVVQPTSSQRLQVDFDVSIDVTEMEVEELRQKLEIIDDVLGDDGE